MAKKTPVAAAAAQAPAAPAGPSAKSAPEPTAKSTAATTAKAAPKSTAQSAAKAPRPAAKAASATVAVKVSSPKPTALKTVSADRPRRPIPLTIVKNDPWLAPFEDVLRARQARLQARLAEIEQHHGSLLNYATVHQQLGLNHDATRGGWVYREWAPGAQALFLIGDFNGWDRQANPYKSSISACGKSFCPMPNTTSA